MQFRVVLGREGDIVIALCPQLPGCSSSGADMQEALDNITEAIHEYFASQIKHRIKFCINATLAKSPRALYLYSNEAWCKLRAIQFSYVNNFMSTITSRYSGQGQNARNN